MKLCGDHSDRLKNKTVLLMDPERLILFAKTMQLRLSAANLLILISRICLM